MNCIHRKPQMRVVSGFRPAANLTRGRICIYWYKFRGLGYDIQLPVMHS